MSDLPLPTEGLYEDAKRVLRTIASPIIRPLRERHTRRRILREFSPELARHPRTVTRVVDYYSWHEDKSDWRRKKGALLATTYRELFRLWTLPDIFVPYEAHLLRFIRAGGETRRVFLLGSELADPLQVWALHRVLLRHERLGFRPRVRSVLDIRAPLLQPGVSCDMAGVLNGEVVYLFQFPDGAEPLMLRTIDTNLARRSENLFNKFWHEAEEFDSWYPQQQYRPPAEVLKQVELDLEAVHTVAS